MIFFDKPLFINPGGYYLSASDVGPGAIPKYLPIRDVAITTSRRAHLRPKRSLGGPR